ncbi:myotubularin-related protein 6 isoform X3 [Halyomorpha halys]
MHISTIEKLSLTAEGCPLLIRCKTFLSITFIIPRERDCHEVYSTLLQLSQPSCFEDLYCFRYTSSCEDIPKNAGWNFFDLQAEYQRMRVPNDQWCLTLLNQNFKLCDTYPAYIYVPVKASPSILVGSSKFRSKGRLPVLSYLHKNKAAICRCSQPLSGFNARCLEDEQMLDCILNTNSNFNYMFVVDTRPRINAMANRATGKGYENENFYENIKFHFLGIENIHVMRSSLVKLIETCELKTPTMSSFLSGLESSGWLKHIKAILDTSFFIAQAVEQGISVVVHCSDGWDRTAQVCSLASMLLDPYYRSIQGFQALIEKEWLSFGHKFTDRVGHLGGDSKEISPIFTQMIDCTWQLMQQFPLEFQFNEFFLFTLHDHISSCQYGTFVGNSEKDRQELSLKERTFSLWGYMANHMREYINSIYSTSSSNEILRPNLLPQNIRFWRGMYCRFECGIHPRESIGDLLLAASGHSESLEEHIKFIKKRMKPPERNKLTRMSHTLSKENTFFFSRNLKDSWEVNSIKMNRRNREGRPHCCVIGEIYLVALDWLSVRNVKTCICAIPFDHFTTKYHCWQCGNVFCVRCIDTNISLPGHASHCAVPVCQPCYHQITCSTP